MQILDIPPGCARLNCCTNKEDGSYTFVLGVTQNKIELRDDGNYGDIKEDTSDIEWIFGIKLVDWRQAMGYATTFSKIANEMRALKGNRTDKR